MRGPAGGRGSASPASAETGGGWAVQLPDHAAGLDSCRLALRQGAGAKVHDPRVVARAEGGAESVGGKEGICVWGERGREEGEEDCE